LLEGFLIISQCPIFTLFVNLLSTALNACQYLL